MSSPTDFNLSPYYDDFTESKKFHRILFRPTFAVQARELTQAQTILQNQMERMGDHFFKQGAMVIPGQVGLDIEYYAVKLSAKSLSTLSSYNNVEVTGATSGVVATIVNTVITDGTDPDTVYVKYSKSGTNNVASVFQDGETLNCSVESVSQTLTVSTTATGSAASVKQGIYYINGFMVQTSDHTLILDKYTNEPSYRIGFTLTESFVTSNDDSSLNDNAAGSSNANAPGAHRFKIDLTLAKKTLASTEDSNFYEILRVENGVIRSQVRSTEYNILEENLARRTFDESGDYTLTNPDFDVREHLISGNNRGIYTSGNGGDATKLAVGVAPFKSYVRGYENQILTTTFLDVDKSRDTFTENNNKTRFNLKNYVNVSNVYGSPDVGFVSGDVEAFKAVNLYKDSTTTRGTQVSTVGVNVPQIGRAKSRGFEFVTGTESTDIYATTSTYKHYLFDIELFTHLNLQSTGAFTTGEVVSGSTSGATGVVMSMTATKSTAVTSISVANPGVVTLNAHGFVDGQQITLSGGTYSVASSAVSTDTVYTVKNSATNTFELFDEAGTASVNVTAHSAGPTAKHTVVVVSNVQGTFSSGETITGNISNVSGTIQANRFGLSGVTTFDFSTIKQIGMAGSPTYTADVKVDSTYGNSTVLTGNITVANSDATILGKGTTFNSDLKISDSITFTNNAGGTVTKIVKYIVSDTELELTANVGGSDVTTAGVITRNRTKLQNPENNISVFKLPYINIKTLKTTNNSGVTDTNFNVRRNFTGTLSSTGTVTITAGTNELFASQSNTDYTVSVMTTGSGGTGAVGDVLNTSGNNHEGSAIFILGGSPTGKTLTFDFGANLQGHKVKILATISRSVAGSKTKTLNAASTVAVSSQSIIESGVIGLAKADVYKINNIYMAANFSTAATTGNTNITSRFDLDNGQRDNYYDIGRIKLKPGALKPTGRLLIDFDYFSHGSGDYFDVDTYSGVIDYENIQSYTSDTTGIKYQLRDSLDFRPRVDDASTVSGSTSGSDFERSYNGTGSSTVDVVKFSSDVTTDFQFFINRIDKIFITREGTLKVLKGAAALNPLKPGNLEGHLHLATLKIPSYTLNTDDVIVEQEDNKRFTMRDIGRLEKRIQNVEYYTQLSLLEADAQSLQIQDAEGYDRFKNGFVVDNFTGHNIGDVGNNDYKISIDRGRGEARTMFNEDVIELEEVDNDGTAILDADRTAAGYQKTGDLITLPYTETSVIEQPFATKTENLNPFFIFNWIGNIELDPPLDEWKETERAPDLVVNLNGTFDNLARELGLDNTTTTSIPFGTEWNEWQDQWSGNPRTSSSQSGNTITTTTNVDVVQTRAGIRTDIIPKTVTQSLGDRVIAVNFVPFIRSRDITFTAQGLRPNTKVYPFFDNIDVTSYVTPSGGSLGGNLITNTNGLVIGTFAIPDSKVDSNPRWRTGKRVFRLTSSSTNANDVTAAATSGEADYVARGLQETTRDVIVSTREARTVRVSTSQTRTVGRVANRTVQTIQRQQDREPGDPLAQSFIIDTVDGTFVTSLDIYFATKSTTIPVRAEIRNMVNGYPGSTILPFSQKYLNPSEVNTSTDGSVATTFTFNSPVYLNEGIEYCIVLYTDSQDYTTYVARLGETALVSNRTVSKQPATGVFFKSANNRTWSPEQMEDLKFNLKKAVFTTNTTSTVTLANKLLPSKILDTNPMRTFNGTGLIRVFHKNHGHHSTTDNVTISGIASGTYNGIAHSAINGTYTSISNITLDSYDITTTGTANASGDIGGSTVSATQNRLFNVIQLQIGTVVHPGTTLSPTLRTTKGRSVNGVETPFVLQAASSIHQVVNGDNIYFGVPRMVASGINETNEMASSQSLFENLAITTSNANLSPVIDVKRLNAFVITNRLNNPLVSSTNTFTGDGSDTTFTLSGTPTSVHLLSVKKNGEKLQPVDDFTVSGTTLTMGVAPASGSSVVVKITNTVDYEDDTSIEGGSSEGAYITKSIALANTSTALDIRVAASIRSTSSIKAFYRLSGGDETRRIEDIEFTPFNTDGSSDVAVDPSTGDITLDNNFKDHKFSVSNTQDFTSFQIKIVFNGTNSAFPARLKDFRAIALAI